DLGPARHARPLVAGALAAIGRGLELGFDVRGPDVLVERARDGVQSLALVVGERDDGLDGAAHELVYALGVHAAVRGRDDHVAALALRLDDGLGLRVALLAALRELRRARARAAIEQVHAARAPLVVAGHDALDEVAMPARA